jgi:hypothetical protein
MPRGRGKVTIEVSRELRDRIRELSHKYGLLYEELLWKAFDTLTQSNTLSNTLSTKGPITQSITQSKVVGYEWCKPKSSIKNLEGYVKYLERSLGLEDWWDEGDRYCFKTRRKPAKTE